MNGEGSRQKKKQILGRKPFRSKWISSCIAGQWERSVLGSKMAAAHGGDQSMKKAPSVKPSRTVRGCHVAVRRASSYCGMERYGTKEQERLLADCSGGEGRFTQKNQNLMMGIRETETREVEQNMGCLQFDTISSKKQEVNNNTSLLHTV